MHCQQNTIITGSKHRELVYTSAGLVLLTLKFQFSIDINNLKNLLVILLSSLNHTTYVLFFN